MCTHKCFIYAYMYIYSGVYMYERKPKMLTVPVTVGAANGSKVRPYLSREADSNLSGNEVYHTNSIMLLVKKM